MTIKQEQVWYNGTTQRADKVRWPLDDRGLGLGDGLFETIKLLDAKPRFFEDHWQRLQCSAKALGFDPLPESTKIKTAVIELARQNKLENGSIRILLSRGTGPRGIGLPDPQNSSLLIRTFAPQPKRSEPLMLALSRIRRCASNPTHQHKTLSHLDMIMSRQWLKNGAQGNESLVLDSRGYVSSVGIGNIFWVRNKILFTPSTACAILPGTTRARILSLCHKENIEVRIGAFWPKSLIQADMVCISNALIGVGPVQCVDLGQGQGRGQRKEFTGTHQLVNQLQTAERAMI